MCARNTKLEASLAVMLPDLSLAARRSWRSPWRRSYSRSKLAKSVDIWALVREKPVCCKISRSPAKHLGTSSKCYTKVPLKESLGIIFRSNIVKLFIEVTATAVQHLMLTISLNPTRMSDLSGAGTKLKPDNNPSKTPTFIHSILVLLRDDLDPDQGSGNLYDHSPLGDGILTH